MKSVPSYRLVEWLRDERAHPIVVSMCKEELTRRWGEPVTAENLQRVLAEEEARGGK